MLSFQQPLLLLLIIPIGILVYLTWKRMALPFPARQRRLILACRLALFTLVLAALAGASLSLPVTHQATVFVGDISASTGAQRAFMEQWIDAALRNKPPGDQVGIVAFGRNALVEQSVQQQVDFSHFESTPDTNYTDIAGGLRLAAAILPTNAQRHIILLTDGQQNLGDALQEAQLLQQQGIRLDIVPLPSSNGPEARIDGIDVPTEVQTNERFVMHVKIYTNVAQTAILRLYLDQALILQQSIKLSVGEQEASFDLLAPSPGFHTYRVTLDAPHDTILQNNEAAAFVNVQGPPQVLVIEGSPGSGQNIVSALRATGIEVTVGTPNDVPTTLDTLATYSSVVLADVPAAALGTERMETLQSFVRDLGRGLVVSGGQNSYGVGGYSGTPLEQTLPLSMAIPQHKETPSIALVLIIESLEADLPINISKEAAKEVVNLLTPQDQVGISAAYGTLSIPMQHATNANKAAIDRQIDAMNPNDPGSYNPDLANAEQVLLHTNAKIKHVILLGDGDAYDNYAPQVTKMASEGITVSTVETNAQSIDDLTTMIDIANWGKGRFYRADDPNTIPQILLKETEQAARRTIINEAFTPAVVGNSPILTGLGPLPELDGYVATTPKPTAQMVLVSHRDDPVLAAWQYGLGRVVAWTSDALGLWTSHWLAWKNAPRFWANLVTWTLPTPNSMLDINGQVVGGTGHLTVDLPAASTGPVSQQQVQARIIAPDHSQEQITLQPTAPQRWEGDFPATQVGAYLIQVSWRDQHSANRLTSTTGLVVPYSPEFSTIGTNLPFLKLLAQAGGGTLLGANASGQAFAQKLTPVTATIPITFWLLALAALLLPIDIAARRLSSLEFITLGYRWLLGRLPARRAPPEPGGADRQISEGAIGSSLFSLRERRAEQRRRAVELKPAPSETQRARAAKTVPPARTPPKVPPAPAQPKQPEASTTERLLEAKRRRGRVAAPDEE